MVNAIAMLNCLAARCKGCTNPSPITCDRCDVTVSYRKHRDMAIEQTISDKSDERVRLMDRFCMDCPATKVCGEGCSTWWAVENLKVEIDNLERLVA